MEFLITSFTYPLKEKILFSKHFNFYLDNPRTKEEVDIVKHFLRRSYNSGHDLKIPPKFKDDELNEKFITLEKLIADLYEMFYSKNEEFTDFFDKHQKKSIFDFVARMWIIARFDDEGESKRLRKEKRQYKKQGTPVVIVLDEEHPIIKKSNILLDYSYLIALLAHTESEDYFGRSFIYDNDRSADMNHFWREFLMFIMQCRTYTDNEYRKSRWEKESLRWTYFPEFCEKLEKIRELVDFALSNSLEEKLLYVGNTLRIAHDNWEKKSRLLMLTSIIEMLLTHNPNTNRFNVEDSINKQFQLKTSILVYLNDKNRNIKVIQKRLKTIYEQRSNVAHGNLGAFNKFIQNLSKKEGEEEYFDSLITDLYLYIRAILEEYLKDKEFVEFLKDN